MRERLTGQQDPKIKVLWNGQEYTLAGQVEDLSLYQVESLFSQLTKMPLSGGFLIEGENLKKKASQVVFSPLTDRIVLFVDTENLTFRIGLAD